MNIVTSRSSVEASPAMRFFFSRIFPWPFFLCGIIVLFFGLRSMLSASASKGWPSSSGRIEISRVEDHSSSDGTTYHAEVAYIFSVDGIQHRSNRVAYGDYGSSDPEHAQEIVNRYPAGSIVDVFYNPQKPSEAVLETGIKGQAYFLPSLGACFAIVGGLMLWGLPKLMKRSDEAPNNNPIGA